MKHSPPATFHLEPCCPMAVYKPRKSSQMGQIWNKTGNGHNLPSGPSGELWSACIIGHREGDFSRSVRAPGCTNFRHSRSNGAGVPDLRSRAIDPQGTYRSLIVHHAAPRMGSDGRKLPDALLNDGEFYDCQHCP